MKYIKTFEGHSAKKDKISKGDLNKILSQVNLVTIPFFDDENAILHHIEKNFDKNDAALMYNPPKEITSIEHNGDTAILYTKNKTYIIEDVSDMEIEELQNGVEPDQPDQQQY